MIIMLRGKRFIVMFGGTQYARPSTLTDAESAGGVRRS